VRWDLAEHLYGHRADERIYTVSVGEDGETTVRFGDGRTGARLDSGRDNVVATYRQGLGLAGNLPPGALRTLLDRPPGLRAVSNPAAAAGGADPEPLDQARANAPNTVRTFGRIVSLRDVEDAAREFAGITKARATWTWAGAEQVVRLVVAGAAGGHVAGATMADLAADLDRRRDPNRRLLIVDYRDVPVQVAAVVHVDPAHQAETVRAAARAALLDRFAFARMGLGQPVHLSDVYRGLQDTPGVTAAVVTGLRRRDGHDPAGPAGPAAPVPRRLPIGPDELAVLADQDLEIGIGGGA
jgi:predicted phage baseplate assembly protein